jgi:hypothetical protein
MTRRLGFCFLARVFVFLMILSCSQGKGRSQAAAPASYLADKIPDIGLKRIAVAKTYTGQALYDYIDGGAEQYFKRHFVQVATAEYGRDTSQIVVDIYQFASDSDAFALYLELRPPEADTIKIGRQGYGSTNGLDFVKGPYLIKLVSFESNPGMTRDILNLGKWLDKTIPKR